MTNKELNNHIEKINNEINCYLDMKELLEKKYQSEIGNKQNLKNDIKNLNEIIDDLYSERLTYIITLENQLKKLKMYNELELKIIDYKENALKKYTWVEIAEKVNYSETQCRRIYRKYKKQRSID